MTLYQRSVLRCPTPKLVSCLKNVEVSKSLEELEREVSRAQGQQVGKEEYSETSVENGLSTSAEVGMGSVWATTQPFAHAGRSFDVSRWNVGRIGRGAKSCEDTRNATELPNRSWDVPLICTVARAPSGRRRQNRRSPSCVFEQLLCPGDGSQLLAAVMDCWP